MIVRRVDFSKRFEKDLKKSPKKIQIAFRSRLEIYLTDRFNPVLNNHTLTGKFEGHRSINVTGDWRAIFRELDGGEIVYFDLLETHSRLYR